MSIYENRRGFFSEVAKRIGRHPGSLIVLTHCLPDRPELLDALNDICNISLVIVVPYSINPTTYGSISRKYRVVAPTMEQLTGANFLTELIRPFVNRLATYILEIGGYFARELHALHEEFGSSIVGIVEDTENGHRRYEAMISLPYPVVSVARSPLKLAEDALVGPSCVFSIERILRSRGTLLQGRRVLVLGYGKVGKGTAKALHAKGCHVLVYDVSSVASVLAMAEGFVVPDRRSALATADIIFGCSGFRSIDIADFGFLQDGVFLASCSSKVVEFPVADLAKAADSHIEKGNVHSYEVGGRTVNLVADGAPVNYLDDAVIGPVLALVQAEMMFALELIINEGKMLGSSLINGVADGTREVVAALWSRRFRNPSSGAYVL